VLSYYVVTHYDDWFYRGGALVNHGLFARPRYEASFSSIALNVSARHEYTFSRFPVRTDDATVMLVTNTNHGIPERVVAPLATHVRIRVVDQNNQVVCDAAGSPAGKGADRLWVTSSGDNALALYHTGCHRLSLHACAPCRLTIEIGRVDPATPVMLVRPTIVGGGLELP
jgi:hypothetical protein